MTVVLAIRCADGLVMAADSQITDDAREISYLASKLHPLGDTAAWGGSGARSVLKELEDLFEQESDSVIQADEVARALQDRVQPVLRHHYERYLEDVPGDEGAGTPATYLLAAGYSHGEPFIVELNPNAMIGRYEDIGFHAVGGGSALAMQAHALLSHFPMADRQLDYGVVTAVRVLDALAVTSPKVGGFFSVCRITPDDAEHLSDDDIEEVRRLVGRWQQSEKDLLDRLFDGTDGASWRRA